MPGFCHFGKNSIRDCEFFQTVCLHTAGFIVGFCWRKSQRPSQKEITSQTDKYLVNCFQKCMFLKTNDYVFVSLPSYFFLCCYCPG